MALHSVSKRERDVNHTMPGYILGLAVVALLPLLAHGAEDEPSTVRLGRKIDNFSIPGVPGKKLALYDLKDSNAVVLLFLSFDCPVSNSFRPTMIKLHEQYSKKGVAFVGICTSETEPAQLAKLIKEHHIPFPVYLDGKFAAANAVAAEFTPEAFLLDAKFILQYRGRIDNSYAKRLVKTTELRTDDLKDALDEVLAGKRVSRPATLAVGCPLIRPTKEAKAGTVAVNYHRDVLPILQKSCQSCHRPGGGGPFSLMTYQQAARWSTDIKKFVENKQMPPWQASAGVPFDGEQKMSQKDINTLASWDKLGAPEGDAPASAKPLVFTDGWQLGKPDLILDIGADFTLSATGPDEMARVFPLPGAYQNRRLVGVEILPSNRRIVRSAAVFLGTATSPAGKQKRSKKEEKKAKKEPQPTRVLASDPDSGPGYASLSGPGFVPTGIVGSYDPGQPPRLFPAGSSYALGNRQLVLQVHYHRTGKNEKDRTRVGLYFAKSGGQDYQGLVLSATPASIPAAAERHRFAGTITLDQDCEIHSVMPSMSFLGKDIKVSLTPPGGKEQLLVAINGWDPHWRQTYHLKQPLKVKAGTRIAVEAHFDNSVANPHNPFRPPRPMRIGYQVGDEQCTVFLGTTAAKTIAGPLVLK